MTDEANITLPSPNSRTVKTIMLLFDIDGDS